jgi:hypothetical protein
VFGAQPILNVAPWSTSSLLEQLVSAARDGVLRIQTFESF